MIRKIKNIYHFVNALLSVIYFGYPSRNINVIGVTGTDGKTTTSTLIAEILRNAGYKVALVSTLGGFIDSKKYDTGLHTTSPSPWLLNKILSLAVRQKCEYAVLEVTSHGLDQYRFEGIDFKIAVLTNITHEHLDYHKTFDNYVKTKTKLFRKSKIAILNKEDKSSFKIKKLLHQNKKIIFYDSKIPNTKLSKAVIGRFPQKYNQLNASAGIAVAKNLSIDERIITKSIETFPDISGRMEQIKNSQGFRIIVDFAHTPNALSNLLLFLKKQLQKNKKLVVVLGCAGERDIKKRPIMGKIAVELADISIFTAEDPRSESVEKIISQIEKGAKKVKSNHKYIKIIDRAEAITYAIQNLAKPGDIVAICGKGHEKSMAFNGVEYPWSDQKTVSHALRVIN